MPTDPTKDPVIEPDQENQAAQTANPEIPTELPDEIKKIIESGNFQIEMLLTHDPKYHKEVALKLIKAGQGYYVADNLEKFQGLDHKEVALKLIKAEKGEHVAHHLDKFQGLDHKEIALKLIEAGKGEHVAHHLDKFQGLDHKEIALKLIEVERDYYVDEFLNTFQGLDKEVALKLIEVGKGYYVAKYLKKFQGLDHKEIALKLIEDGMGKAVAGNLEEFQGVDNDVALKLIEAEQVDSVSKHLNNFKEFNKIALILIEKGYVKHLKYHLEQGHINNLDKNVALKLIEAGHGQSVAENLDKFQGVDNDLVFNLIEAGHGKFLASLRKFQGLDYKGIALKLIETDNSQRISMDFQGLDKNIAMKLIEAGKGGVVLEKSWGGGHTIDFQGLDKDVALKLIEAGHGQSVAENLDKFQGVDNDLVFNLIEAGHGTFLAKHLNKSHGLDYKEIALKLIEADDGYSVATHLDKFQGLDHKEIALILIETGNGQRISRNFQGLDKDIAMKLIEAGKGGVVLEKSWDGGHTIDFQGLDKDVALKLIEAGQGQSVAENLDKFPDLEAEFEKKYGKEIFTDYKDNIFELIRGNQWPNFSKEDLELSYDEEKLERNKINILHFFELNFLAKFKPLSEFSLATEEGAKEIFDLLKTSSLKGWSDSTLAGKFELGSNVFGYKKMFFYCSSGNDFHDAFYAFDRIIELQKASGLSAEVFYNNILQQVGMDMGTYGYENSTSYQKLNEITENLRLDFDEVIKEAKEYADEIPKLAELLKGITSLEDVFSGWKMLIQYKELTNLLSQREILEELKEIKDPKLKKYISTLLFHPAVSDKQAVLMFMKDPYQFFDLDSAHTPEEVHNRKKPTNYVDIPHLDLSAEELRDALVGGTLDKVQTWQPMEIVYEIPENLNDLEDITERITKIPLIEAIIKALGKRGQVKGELNENSAKKLFGDINQLLKTKFPDKKVTLKDMIEGKVEVTPDLETEIKKLITKYYKEELQKTTKQQKKKTAKYKVKINLKSDPDAVIAGNETQCCMPFGDGKNTLYTFNPICGLLTVQKETGEGGFRTIAQSVLTQDKDIGKNISELREFIEAQGELHLDELLPESILHTSPSHIACDSVEVANNYQTEFFSNLMSSLYIDALREYLKKHGKAQNLDAKKVVIGAQYGFTLSAQGTMSNTFLPESPVAYSDKYTDTVGTLDLTQSPAEFYTERMVRETTVDRQKKPNIHNPKIQYLTYKDTLATAYIEGKAYQHTSLKEGLANMENMLIAKDINNSAKGRANMCLKYVTEDGEMLAYLVAYEGNTMPKNEEEYAEDGPSVHERCLYVADLAKMPKAEKGVGMELINEFIRLYKINYLDKGVLMAIKADAREVSSYKLIVRNLNETGESIGVKFEMEEGETYKREGDTMHPITIRPKKLT